MCGEYCTKAAGLLRVKATLLVLIGSIITPEGVNAVREEMISFNYVKVEEI